MLSQKEMKFSDIKIGRYKKTLTDVHHWQIKAKGQKPPFIQFLSWLFGN